MSYYIPTISQELSKYPFLKKTFRKDYYRFKKIPEAIYDSLSSKAQVLYDEIEDKEEDRFWNSIPFNLKLAIICGCISATLSTIGLILRSLVK